MITNEISGLWLVIFLSTMFNCLSAQMKWSSWSRYSQCTVTCGQGRQRRQRQCIKTSPTATGTCPGPKEMYAPCQMLACPKKEIRPCNCGCTLKDKGGRIMSQLASKITASCEWKILAEKGNTVALNVTRLVLKSGWVRIASGKKTLFTLLKPGPEPKYPWQYKSTGNVMTLELLSYPDARGNLDSNTYLSASYVQIEASKTPAPKNTRNLIETTNTSGKEPNVPAIIGITACVIVIILVAVFLAVRRHRRKDQSESNRENEATSLNNEYEPHGKLQGNGTTEEKLLVEGKASPQLGRQDRYYQAPPQAMLGLNFVQGRDSSGYSSGFSTQNPQFNGHRRGNYLPEMQMKQPNLVVDPNFVRVVPMTTNTVMIKPSQPLQVQQQQKFVMQAPMPPRSDHS